MWNYVWWWKMWISKKEIENMKKNMKKVPIIQLKSDIYHKSEEVNAEKIINKVTEATETSRVSKDWNNVKNLKKESKLVVDNWNKKNWFYKLIDRVWKILFNK